MSEERLQEIKEKTKLFHKNGVFSLEYDKETLRDMVLEYQEEIERLNNIINELEKELDRAYLDLFEYELVNGREFITNIKNYIQELKGSDKE